MTKNKCHKSKIFQRSGAEFTLRSTKVYIFHFLSYFGLTLFEVKLVQGSVFIFFQSCNFVSLVDEWKGVDCA